jgi:hypothetical protein
MNLFSFNTGGSSQYSGCMNNNNNNNNNNNSNSTNIIQHNKNDSDGKLRQKINKHTKSEGICDPKLEKNILNLDDVFYYLIDIDCIRKR